jgi:hypothetical protein
MTGRVEAPRLPPEVPDDLRRFVECTADSVTIADGPLTWVSLPAEATLFLSRDTKPELRISPGPAPSSATARVKVGFISAELGLQVSNGRLVVDASRLPGWAPASVADGLRLAVDELNAWFAQNGVALAPPTFGPAGTTFRKVRLGPP